VHRSEPGAWSNNQNLQLIRTVGCIRNLDTNKERQKAIEQFWKESV
jgi:hypothetical protein